MDDALSFLVFSFLFFLVSFFLFLLSFSCLFLLSFCFFFLFLFSSYCHFPLSSLPLSMLFFDSNFRPQYLFFDTNMHGYSFFRVCFFLSPLPCFFFLLFIVSFLFLFIVSVFSSYLFVLLPDFFRCHSLIQISLTREWMEHFLSFSVFLKEGRKENKGKNKQTYHFRCHFLIQILSHNISSLIRECMGDRLFHIVTLLEMDSLL